MTRSPSSAVRRSSSSTVSTAVCSGESRQIAAISASSASGASFTSMVIAASERVHDVRISGRTSGSTASPCSTKVVQARTASCRRELSSLRTTALRLPPCHERGHTRSCNLNQRPRSAAARIGEAVTRKPPAGADDALPAGLARPPKLKSAVYQAELARLQEELVMLQYWIQRQGL